MSLLLVYRGPAASEGCPEAVARLLRWTLPECTVAYVGPRERLALNAATLSTASLYAQPGGDSVKAAWRHLRGHRDEVRAFVAQGGHYLGVCLGAYLAGHEPGFGLVDGEPVPYITTAGASLRTEDAALLEIVWGERRPMYVQDPCVLPADAGASVVATFDNGQPAAMVSSFGRGRVALSGPHPEASDDWFIDDGLPTPARPTLDLGADLVRRLFA